VASRLPSQTPPQNRHKPLRPNRPRWPESHVSDVRQSPATPPQECEPFWDGWDTYKWELDQDALEIGAIEAQPPPAQRIPPRQGEGCWKCGVSGHISSNCPEKQCLVCKEWGHSVAGCPKRG